MYPSTTNASLRTGDPASTYSPRAFTAEHHRGDAHFGEDVDCDSRPCGPSDIWVHMTRIGHPMT